MIFYYLVLGSAAVLGITVYRAWLMQHSNGRCQPVGRQIHLALRCLLNRSMALWAHSQCSGVAEQNSGRGSEKKLERWQIQDEKLLKEVQQDRGQAARSKDCHP